MPDGTGEVVRGPNIKAVPLGEPVAETLEAPVLLKLGDKVSTDDISPVGLGRTRLPVERARHRRVLLPQRRCRVRGARQGGRARHHRRGRDLRPGLVARGGRHGAHAPRRARRHRQVVRAHPPRQSHQLGPRPARLRRSGRLGGDRARRSPASRRPALGAGGRDRGSRSPTSEAATASPLVRPDAARARHPLSPGACWPTRAAAAEAPGARAQRRSHTP